MLYKKKEKEDDYKRTTTISRSDEPGGNFRFVRSCAGGDMLRTIYPDEGATEVKMTREEAVKILENAVRHELRDHAFGDCEVSWNKGEEEIASGYFGHCSSISIKVEDDWIHFEGKDADELRGCGQVGNIERNDETGPDKFEQGKVLDALTLEGVLKEITRRN